MRNAKGLHIFLGLLAAAISVAAVAMAVPAKLLIAQPGEASFQTVFSSSMALPMAVMYPLLSMASAAALSCAPTWSCGATATTFGRDYYNLLAPAGRPLGLHPHGRVPGLPGMALRGPAREYPDHEPWRPRWDTSGWPPQRWACSA